jgi:preprotein translocase subunit SecE
MSESTTAPAPKKRDQPEKRTSPFTFYRQVVAELRKVVWPTQQQLTAYFVVVLAFVLMLMLIVSLLDLGLGKAFFAIFGGHN